MSAIVTLTMNPALDKSTRTPYVTAEDKLRCATLTVEPGGGGVNVSRAIHQLGGDSLLLYLGGGLNGQAFDLLLQARGLRAQRLPINGMTRESFTVFEESSTHQYRFNMPGPTLDEAEWRGVLATVAALEPMPTYLVASGSLPPGAPQDFYVQLAQTVAEWPTQVVVDTSGPALHALIRSQVPLFLIKPNLRELAALVGSELEGDEAIVSAARTVMAQSHITVMVVSLGGAGVLLVTRELAVHLRAPTVPIRSKIGAGDSSVAGIVLALARGLPLIEAVRFGVATGSATVMTPGTELCRRQDAERLYEQMRRDTVATQ